nr:alpha-amidating enzyme precursor 2 [Biomphalaria glabrata]
MFAWAKNAPPTVMPKGVGLRVGSKTSIQTIVVQVHYAKVFKDSEPEDHSGLKFYTTHQKQEISKCVVSYLLLFKKQKLYLGRD